MEMTSFEQYSCQSTVEQRDQELYKMYDDIERQLEDQELLQSVVKALDFINKYEFQGVIYD